MVFDCMENIDFYQTYGEKFEIAVNYIKRVLSHDEKPQTYVELMGKDVFACLQEYTTAETCAWEAHRKYIDIQILLSGNEIIGYAPVSLFAPNAEYDTDNDCLLIDKIDTYTNLHMYPGCFAIFYPNDAHMPKHILDVPSNNKKLLIKIAV